jgi:cytochrome c oxidase subunit 2
MYQEISWIVTIILVTLLAIIFLIIANNASGDKSEYTPIQKSAYSLRGKLFLLILLVIVPIIGYTLTQMPYPSVTISSKASKLVNAIGHQWYWEISDTTAKVGDPVMYNVSTADVNHGFGVYDADLNVIAQTQAMPGYTNKLLVSFPTAGKYRILCLEYCGLAHHSMISEITVTE